MLSLPFKYYSVAVPQQGGLKKVYPIQGGHNRLVREELHSQPGMNMATSPYKAVMLLSHTTAALPPPPNILLYPIDE